MGRFAILLFCSFAQALPGFLSGMVWPTPNPAFQQGRALESFIQPSSSGKIESGLFGCVRNDGRKFHEGIDLFPLRRDRSGEAADPVYSILPGRVVHINQTSGHSSYGCYLVVEHDGEDPVFYSLYSHLAHIAGGVRPGTRVESGTVLGRMGRSAGGYTIPKSRAHLHFEVGFRLSDRFQEWYDRQPFKEPNRHGLWNGMNLAGIDPLAFYRALRDGRANSMKSHLASLPAVARIRVFSRSVPDFVKRHPSLVTRPYNGAGIVAWDIAFTRYGVPREWTPRFAAEGIDGRPGDVQILSYQSRLLEEQSCKRVLDLAPSGPRISKGTLEDLKKLFDFR
ncbi:MAG: M23 family metallopeptidase [Coraliomargarita sp.]